MATIKLDYIFVKDFLSYQKEKFYFSEGVFGIVGLNKDSSKKNKSNGAGKTGIPDAILFALTGITFKGLKANNVIREGQKSCFVKLAFTVNGKKGYIISKRNPTEIKFHNGSKFVKTSTLPEMQKKIMNFFGIDYDLLTRFILVGEKEKHKFSFLGADDRTIKDLLTKLTNSEVIDVAYKKVIDDERKYNKEFIEVETKIKLQEDFLENYKKDLYLHKQKIKQLITNTTDNKTISKIENELVKIEDELRELSISVNNVSNDIIVIENKYEKRIRSIQKIIDSLETKIKIFKGNLNNNKEIICPSCGSKILLDNDLNIIKHIKIIKKRITILQNKKLNFNKKLNRIENEKEYLKLKLNKTKKKIEEVYEIKEEELERLTENLNEIKNKVNVEKKILLNNQREIKKKINDVKTLLAVYGEQFNKTKKILDTVTKFKFYFGKEGLKNYLFSKKLKLIEYTVNRVLEETNTNMTVKLSGMTKLKSGKWNQKISGKITINNKERDYVNLSKGEGRIIDLAFIEAFGRLLNIKNDIKIKMFDEPFSGLDEDGKRDVIEMLKNIKNNSVYVLSPETDLIYKTFDEENIFTVVKQNNVSKIQKGYV